jgi:hypothetical protein
LDNAGLGIETEGLKYVSARRARPFDSRVPRQRVQGGLEELA